MRSWFSDQFGGIKEGLEKRSFIALILWNKDRRVGARGAFGSNESNYVARHFKLDPKPAQNAARGPRPYTWGKQMAIRKVSQILNAGGGGLPTEIFTK